MVNYESISTNSKFVELAGVIEWFKTLIFDFLLNFRLNGQLQILGQ